MPFVERPDGVRIAYETHGSGPPLILLHGGGQSRKTWIDAGYVESLAARREVILMDARAHGESDGPLERSAYSLEAVTGDVLAVADACGAQRFDLVGYSYGGNVGRFVAAHSGRVDRFVLIGIGFGAGAEGPFRARIDEMLAPWAPVLRDPPEPEALSPELQTLWAQPSTQGRLAWFGALLEWPGLEPQDLACPTLWLVGSKNEVGALDNFHAHRPDFAKHGIQGVILDGLDHAAEMTATEMVLPLVDGFLT